MYKWRRTNRQIGLRVVKHLNSLFSNPYDACVTCISLWICLRSFAPLFIRFTRPHLFERHKVFKSLSNLCMKQCMKILSVMSLHSVYDCNLRGGSWHRKCIKVNPFLLCASWKTSQWNVSVKTLQLRTISTLQLIESNI